jgi:hypothetical protein
MTWVVAATFFATLGIVPASGAGGGFDSKVTLAVADPFHGRVISDKPACERARKVKVFDEQKGPDGLYGSTRTDRDGKWSIAASPNGTFYAVVTREQKGPAGAPFVCRRDVSVTRLFD